jgi:hypothetical protein
MNLTLAIAIAVLAGWIVLLFVAHIPSGNINLLYAAGVVLIARRVLAGAPKFVS